LEGKLQGVDGRMWDDSTWKEGENSKYEDAVNDLNRWNRHYHGSLWDELWNKISRKRGTILAMSQEGYRRSIDVLNRRCACIKTREKFDSSLGKSNIV